MWKKLQEFNANPYVYVDNLSLTVKGINLNIFQKYKYIQSVAIKGALLCLGLWIVFGFDSTPLQFIHALYEGIPGLITGSLTLSDVAGIYHLYYGKEMHYSAFVIYFGLYYFLSRSWEKAGVHYSKNMVFSFAGMFLSIAVFEWFWIYGFSFFQNQPWVSTWQFPQLKILLQNSVFSIAGGCAVLYMLTERWFWNGKEQLGRAYYFRLKEKTPWILLGLSVVAALFWIYYPWSVEQLQVTLETGEIWISSRMFPQTLYTVDVNPLDSINAGEWFWIENDLIHAVNTGVKVIWAITTYYIFRVKGLWEKKDEV